jgi:hypothetical protein
VEEQPVPWAEVVRAFGEMIIIRHDADRMVVLPRYRDRDAANEEDD